MLVPSSAGKACAPKQNSCLGLLLCSVRMGWSLYWLTNSFRAWLMRGMYTRWRLKRCTSLSGSSIFSSSIYIKMLLNVVTTSRWTSLHSRSIRWLWTELPVIMLPLFSPRTRSMCRPTSKFSTPWSHRTRDGVPNTSHASRKSCRTVLALLLFEHLRYTTQRE